MFNEITKQAVLDAFRHPRDLDQELVDAYLARRALDYLVGFTLSPVLWRKLPGSRSAGRVQSVALRLICEREAEIEAFKAREYWTIEVDFATADGRPLHRPPHASRRQEARQVRSRQRSRGARAADAIAAAQLRRRLGRAKQVKRIPSPPFTTSTLQQEASRKLGFGATPHHAHRAAPLRRLDIDGETVGLITYMRTDGVTLAGEAIAAARRLIGADFGRTICRTSRASITAKAKNAQEAHEAIRPTDLSVARQVARSRRRPAHSSTN